jgi:hypothetical protein
MEPEFGLERPIERVSERCVCVAAQFIESTYNAASDFMRSVETSPISQLLTRRSIPARSPVT